MTLSIEKHNDHIFWFDLCPNNESAFISVYLIIDEKIAIIETGPACSHDSLVRGIQAAGLNLQDIDYVIPTHIHLDHFGGGGHKFAAGAVIKGNKDTIVPQVISETKASLERQAA